MPSRFALNRDNCFRTPSRELSDGSSRVLSYSSATLAMTSGSVLAVGEDTIRPTRLVDRLSGSQIVVSPFRYRMTT